MVLKIASCADLHFGANMNKTQQLFDNLEEYFIKFCEENKVNVITVCGDLFHQKLPLTSNEAQLADQFIHRLKFRFPDSLIILVKGTKSHDWNQIDIFKELQGPNFRIYNTVTEDYWTCPDGSQFHYLVIPEEYYPDKSVYDKYLKTSEKYDFVFFHGLFGFAGAYALKAGNKFNKICFNSSDFKDCVLAKVVGGHIHDPLCEGKVEYCGSFERWVHGEDLDKGFRYHEYDTEIQKLLKDEMVLNKGCDKFNTILFSDLKRDLGSIEVESLVAYLKEKSKDVASLRIKICKTDTPQQEELSALVASCIQFSNVTISKEAKVQVTHDDEKIRKESEERKKRISEYDGLTFNEITIKYARDVLMKSITDKDIEEVLSN